MSGIIILVMLLHLLIYLHLLEIHTDGESIIGGLTWSEIQA